MSNSKPVTAEDVTVYTAMLNEPLTTWPDNWTVLTSGAEVTFSFTVPEETMTRVREAFEGMEAFEELYDSEIFAEWVRESHRIPDVRTEPVVLKQLNVVAYGYNLRSGNYHIAWFTFKDESSFEFNWGSWKPY
jgi:hypothetical protein